MNVLQAVVLGVVQGLGEFLPISSSAHLVLVPWLLNWPGHSLTFDVALHLGTMLAVIAYFWRELLEVVFFGLTQPQSRDGRLFCYTWVAVRGTGRDYLQKPVADSSDAGYHGCCPMAN